VEIWKGYTIQFFSSGAIDGTKFPEKGNEVLGGMAEAAVLRLE